MSGGTASVVAATAKSAVSSKLKVEIILKPVGDAPIMKQKKFMLEDDKTIGWVMSWVKKYLKLQDSDSLFFYVNQAFAPSPDTVIKNLFECFGAEGKLILHYSKTQAWG